MDKYIIWVKINTNKYYNILIKLNNIGIDLYDIKNYKDYILIKVNIKDYKRIKKYLFTYDIEIFSKTGLIKIKEFVNKYLIFTIASIIGIIMLLLLNNMIFKVDIKSNNESIKKILTSEFENYNLGPMHLKKRHSEIEKIVSSIIDNNKDIIKWLEIKYDGLIMVVNVVEVEDEDIEEDISYCHIIASKDAKINSLSIERGVPLKEINDYVNKGDIILSGDIIHNEEVKNTVCASGKVYGEVWYKVKVEVPFTETVKEYTGKNRYNFNIKINDNIYNIFKSRLKIKDEELTNLYKLNDFEINLVKEKEYKNVVKELSEKEAYDKGINMGVDKINLLLDAEEEILEQKVLKKEVNDSTIYLELFIVTKEDIGYRQIIEEDVDNSEQFNTKNN